LFTDFSLKPSKAKISSFLFSIVKISTRFFIIQSSKNNSTCLTQNPSILNHCFPTANTSFSEC
ncbi:MAG: hypothetical protein ACPHY8_05640, partial [Patescibacteria group bacterium]